MLLKGIKFGLYNVTMPNHPEQGAFDLGDKRRPEPSSDPDSFEGVRRTISGGRKGVRPNPTDPLLKGATELLEEPEAKELPVYTHTIAPHKRVYYIDEDPSGPRLPSWTTRTLHLCETNQTILVTEARRRKKLFTTTEDSEAHREGRPLSFFPAGARVATSDAVRRKTMGMNQPPSTPLPQPR